VDGVVAQALLECGADVHATDDTLGRTALHYACEQACSECVDALLAVGADLQARDLAGATAMSLAWDVSQGKKDSAASAVVQMQQLTKALKVEAPSSPSPPPPPPDHADAPPPPDAESDESLRRKAMPHVRDSASDWSPLRAPPVAASELASSAASSGSEMEYHPGGASWRASSTRLSSPVVTPHRASAEAEAEAAAAAAAAAQNKPFSSSTRPSGLSPSTSGVASTSGGSLNDMVVTPSGEKEPLSTGAKQRRYVSSGDKWPVYSRITLRGVTR